MNMNSPPPSPPTPVTEAELHAFIDGQLPAGRHAEVEAYLACRPNEARRVEIYKTHKHELRRLFDPVLEEALPSRLLKASQVSRREEIPTPWYLQRLVAGLAIAIVSGATGWGIRGNMLPSDTRILANAPSAQSGSVGLALTSASGFAQRAAIAHAIYSPDQRRPVEVDAAHEEQLVTWLSKRMGAPMKPPQLQALGYELEGGRLLPGGQGPVAQFMYRQTQGVGTGSKLTLYVSNDVVDLSSAKDGSAAPSAHSAGTSFRFAQEGQVSVFYWVDGAFGYALSAEADRTELARVSSEVYRQLGSAQTPR